MEELIEGLDPRARLALDVAIGTASASGARVCGTEHLLFGLVATADREFNELADLFALNTLRIERGIRELTVEESPPVVASSATPRLSTRADQALRTPRADDKGPTGAFEVLHGILVDDGSGACRVLHSLGVRPDEVRRLAGYGMRHLSADQIESVISSLDRRGRSLHRPWWGPAADETLVTKAPTPSGPVEVARSRSTIVTLRTVAAGREGFGFTLCLESIRTWMLDPVLQPGELLVPGQGSQTLLGPDLVRLELTSADGAVVDNRVPVARWQKDRPFGGVLVMLGLRTEITRLNDRRLEPRHHVVSDWWLYPRPAPGTVQLRVDWPAESISGLVAFDARPLVETGGSPT